MFFCLAPLTQYVCGMHMFVAYGHSLCYPFVNPMWRAVWIYHKLFICSPLGGHLDCFHTEAQLRKKLPWTFLYMAVGGPGFSLFLGLYLGVASWVIGAYLALAGCQRHWWGSRIDGHSSRGLFLVLTNNRCLSIFFLEPLGECGVESFMVLIGTCIFWIKNDVEHLWNHMNNLSCEVTQSFAHFKNRLSGRLGGSVC